jgi:MFS transporter, DHA2 family, multidrug resistance protein
MAVIDRRPLRGWRFILLNVAAGLANVVVLSNVPGYTILAPYAAANLQGVTPSFGTWATTDHMIGLCLGFPIARWLAVRFGDYRVYVATLVVYAIFSFFCAISDTIWSFVPSASFSGFLAVSFFRSDRLCCLANIRPRKEHSESESGVSSA